MQFRIADTFTDSLAKLTGDEQKAVKTAALAFYGSFARDITGRPASAGRVCMSSMPSTPGSTRSTTASAGCRAATRRATSPGPAAVAGA